MAAVDYSGIEDTIKGVLEADARTTGAAIYVEEEPQFGLSDMQQAVLVYLDRRSAPNTQQNLAAGKRTRYLLQLTVAVLYFSLESFKAACDGRNTLLGNVELVLMANRTLNGKVETLWLEGGELYSVRNPQNSVFTAVAETTVTVDVSAVNT